MDVKRDRDLYSAKLAMAGRGKARNNTACEATISVAKEENHSPEFGWWKEQQMWLSKSRGKVLGSKDTTFFFFYSEQVW